MVAYYAAYGGYNNTGNFSNVLLAGSPVDWLPNITNVNFKQAREAGYGFGVGFDYNAEIKQLKILVNLIAVSVSDSGVLIYNNHYVQFGGNYNYFVRLSVSKNNGGNYQVVYNNKDVSHPDTQNLAYASNWHLSTFKRDYTINLDDDVTNVKFEIYGEDATLPHENIFTREQVMSSFKPWAIRKSNIFKSLDRVNGFFKIRKTGNYVDKSNMQVSDVNNENKGVARIRKSGKWFGQNKIGSN